MWRSGAGRRRQQLAVNEMVAAAHRTGSYREPWRSTPGVWEHFRSEAEILRYVQRAWRTALAGAVYVAIDAGNGDLAADVARAYEATCRRQPGVRQILQAHCNHPAIAAAMRKEQMLLAGLLPQTGENRADATLTAA